MKLLSNIKNKLRIITLLTGMLLLAFCTNAEIFHPTKWSFESKQTAKNEYDLIFTVNIAKGWHIWSPYVADGGPIVMTFNYTTASGFTKIGAIKEVYKALKKYDKGFEMDVLYFENEAKFVQHVKLTSSISTISGSVNFGCCDEHQCLPPDDANFTFNVKFEGTPGTTAVVTPPANDHTDVKAIKLDNKDSSTSISSVENNTQKKGRWPHPKKFKKTGAAGSASRDGLWTIFLAGLLSGFVALLTPCVFPMIPLTVSFFTKKKKSKYEGIKKAIIFGLSIIGIYVGLGLLITVVFGSDALNSLSSNVYVNLAFFVIFLVFAISFLGAFEISLPASWTNNSDRMSERSGLIGIFFMAFTLALVSFSCTGPVVGNLLVLAAYGGGYGGPAVGMFGFAFAMALPFGLFAAFPTMMHNLPRSGGWLNSVKVTLGFIELALALKFLSSADLTYNWGLLKREYFLALWIVIFALLGLYLLGKLKFSHDSDTNHVSVTRLLLAVFSFAFTLYMIPGLWGAPVNLLSGIAPPNEYTEGSWSNASGGASSGGTHGNGKKKKYDELFKSKSPFGLDCYYDYYEALAEARRVKKPLLIDFTGHSCTNCRLMENKVWAVPDVLRKLREDVVIVSLYMDDKTELDSSEKYVSDLSHSKITTLGQMWNDFAGTSFNTNAEPYYVLFDQHEELLGEPTGYNSDVDKFSKLLDDAKIELKKR